MASSMGDDVRDDSLTRSGDHVSSSQFAATMKDNIQVLSSSVQTLAVDWKRHMIQKHMGGT